MCHGWKNRFHFTCTKKFYKLLSFIVKWKQNLYIFLRNNCFKMSSEYWTLGYSPFSFWFSALFPFLLPNLRNHPIKTFYPNGFIFFQVYGFYWSISLPKRHLFSLCPSLFPHVYTVAWGKRVYLHIKPIYLHLSDNVCSCPWAHHGVVWRTDVVYLETLGPF